MAENESFLKGIERLAVLRNLGIPGDWEAFLASVEEAAKLAGPEGFDHLALVGNGDSYIRRYAPEFLKAFELRAAPTSEELLKAIPVLRDLNAKNARAGPKDAPTGFVRRRWKPHVFEGEGIDRRFSELCVLSELRNALRSGDLGVVGSRQFRDFEEDLRSAETFAAMKPQGLPLAITTWCRDDLDQRGIQLHETLTAVNSLAERGELPDASLADGVLKGTPRTNTVPPEADIRA